MNNKQSVIDRLQILKIESGHSDKSFKSLLADITGKTSRTIRRWFSLDSNIQDSDLDRIADHFGKHPHWLRYGERREIANYIDQIMSSKYFGAVILKDRKVEEVNHKFIEMMNLSSDILQNQDVCEYILQQQPETLTDLCLKSNAATLDKGSDIVEMEIILGDMRKHRVETTSLKLDNDRILRILIDQGLSDNDETVTLSNKSTLNILYVDDDNMLAKLFETILINNNCSVKTFNDSASALAEYKLHSKDYDLLISDIIMPGLNGDELAKECLRMNPKLPVILYTGYAQQQQKKSAEDFGVSYYLEKPIDSSELLRLLDKIRIS